MNRIRGVSKLTVNKMAEREGFEPSVAVRLRIFSKDVLSTTQPSLQISACGSVRIVEAGGGGSRERFGVLRVIGSELMQSGRTTTKRQVQFPEPALSEY